jgi:hypothetical protein
LRNTNCDPKKATLNPGGYAGRRTSHQQRRQAL